MFTKILKMYIGITRSYAPVLMCSGALVGMLVSKGRDLDPNELLIPLASLYLLSAASFVFNDIFDLEVDRANKIKRPLASGDLSVRSAWNLWASLTTMGFILAAFIQRREAAFLLSSSYVLSLLYTVKIKKHGLLGNIAVSLLVSLSLVYGAISANNSFPLSMVSLVIISLLLNLAREVIQGIADAPGDALRNVRSMSRRYGVKAAKKLGAGLIVLMLVFAPLSIEVGRVKFFRNYSILYGYVLIATGFAYVIYCLWKAESIGEIRRVLALINVLTVTLIALIIASVVV